MKTYLDYIPCFFKQALDAPRLAHADEGVQKKVMDFIAKIIPPVLPGVSPPDIARKVYKVVEEVLENEDPFNRVKKKSNELALVLYPEVKKTIQDSPEMFIIYTR